MTLPETVAVVGLGLMGGSLARDLRARGVRVLGHDADAATLGEAAELGVVPLSELSPEALSGVELLVLALPVTAAARRLAAIAPALPSGCAVTDLGSTKRSVVAAAEGSGLAARFVGSHPIAGDHRSGWRAARAGLFAGARVFLTPTRATEPAVVQRVERLWVEIGARPEPLGAEEHDRQLAWSSHLPQVLSSALAATLAEGRWRPDQLGPGGRDMTRLAASSADMWSAISADNADLIGDALLALESHLAAFHRALEERDEAALHDFFSRAARWTRETPPAA